MTLKILGKNTIQITAIVLITSCMLSCGTTNRQQKSDRYGKIEGYVFLREQYPQTMLNEVLGDG